MRVFVLDIVCRLRDASVMLWLFVHAMLAGSCLVVVLSISFVCVGLLSLVVYCVWSVVGFSVLSVLCSFGGVSSVCCLVSCLV